MYDYLKAYYEILQVGEDIYDLFSKIKKEIYALYNEYSGVYNSSINNPNDGQTSSKVEDINLEEDNNYYCKEQKNLEDLHQARTPSLIVI